MSKSVLAFIGLGRMGYPMAGHLQEAGHEVRVFDVAPGLADRWAAEHGAHAPDSAREASDGADVVLSSLPADDDLREAARGEDGIFAGIRSGSIWVDHSTASASVSRELDSAARDQGAHFLDAPVSGGVQGAVNGSLTIMIGGDGDAFERVEPIVSVYGSLVTHMGPIGSGQLTKMANQICVVGLCQALAEGLDFAETSGLDARKVVSVMLQGSSASWQMENRSEQMLAGEYDFGFATDLMRKDIGLCLDEARRLSIPLPVTSIVDEFLAEVQQMGGARWDWCSLMERQRAQRETSSRKAPRLDLRGTRAWMP